MPDVAKNPNQPGVLQGAKPNLEYLLTSVESTFCLQAPSVPLGWVTMGSNTLPPQVAQPELKFAWPAAKVQDNSQHWATALPNSEQATASNSVKGK
jgi:hypothetical protein